MGILSVFSCSIVGLFTEPFLKLLNSLAGQLAQAATITQEMEARENERREKEQAILENAKVVRDMEIAKQIQLSLLPPGIPEIIGVGFACRCIPATHVGGDYYDFFTRGKHSVDLAIADVSGHSVGAALIMAETRSVLRAEVKTSGSAREILTVLNELLHEDLSNAELFITMFYAKYNSETRLLSYANAGHNPPLVLRKGLNACIELDAEGLILGINKAVTFEEKSIRLEPEDILLLYTDGVTEATSEQGELFGTERLCGIISRLRESHPEEIINRILYEINQFCGSRPVEDDISIVVMKVEA